MFKKTIEALKATEAAAQAELDALFVPYDPATGGGGVHWHAAGSGILQNALLGLSTLRADLEKRQAAIDAGEQTASEAKAKAVADAEAQVAQANAALEAAKALPEGDSTEGSAAEEATETDAEEAAEDAPTEVTTSA